MSSEKIMKVMSETFLRNSPDDLFEEPYLPLKDLWEICDFSSYNVAREICRFLLEEVDFFIRGGEMFITFDAMKYVLRCMCKFDSLGSFIEADHFFGYNFFPENEEEYE